MTTSRLRNIGLSLLTIVILGWTPSDLLAQTGALEGRVVDAQSGKTLPGVNVTVEGTELGTSTSQRGEFRIKGVPVGTQTVVTSFVGYKTTQREVRVRPGQTTRLQITLSQEAVEVGKVTVLARRQYGSDVSTAALKVDAPVLDVPQTVQTITGDFLEDQDADRLDEVLRNVSGVNAFSSYVDFSMRGFRISEYLVDGTKAQGSFFFATPKLTDVKRIEVVKGPSSVVYGQLEPGGMLNVITKDPRGTPSRTISAGFGRYDQYEASADLTGPLTKGGDLQYRLMGDVESSGSFRKFQETQRYGIIPKVAWTPGTSTKVTLKGRWFDETRGGQRDRGIVAPPRQNGEPNVDALDVDWTANEPGDEATSFGYSAQAEVEHAFTDALRVRSTVRYAHTRYTNRYHEPDDFEQQNGRLMLTRQYRNQEFIIDDIAANLNFIGDVATGPVKHQIVIGGDFYDSDTNTDYTYRNAPPLDVFNPEYGGLNPSSYETSFGLNGNRGNREYGALIQDLITIVPSLKVLGGLRYDSFEQDLSRTYSTGSEQKAGSSKSAFTMRGGVVYKPLSNVSLYGSYSEGFKPPLVFFQRDGLGGPFDPTESWQVETGVKAQWFDGRLTTSAAGYQIAKTNILVTDPNADSFQYIQLGEVGSTGFEVDALGSITPNWSVTANYSYNDAEVTEDSNEDNVGKAQPNAPNHTAALWSRYEFSDLGLGLGGGTIFVGDRETFGDLTIPSYTIFDAAVYYQWRRYNVQLNVKNLFDKRHFTGGYSSTALWPGTPRTFSLSVSVDF